MAGASVGTFHARWALFLGTAILGSHGARTHAKNFRPSVKDFAETGLLEMPNARFHDEAEVNLGASYVDPRDWYFVALRRAASGHTEAPHYGVASGADARAVKLGWGELVERVQTFQFVVAISLSPRST